MALSDFMAALALLIAGVAAISAWRSARASDTSANAAELTFENEFKRVKGRAYWAIYRVHNILDQRIVFDPSIVDLGAVQDLLSIYGHRLPAETREKIRVALNGIDLIITSPGVKDPILGEEYLDLFDRVRPHVRDAAMAVREDYMPQWSNCT